MKKDIPTISGEDTVSEASKIMVKNNTGYVIVMDKIQPVGIVTEKDIVFKIIALDKDPAKVKVSECASKPLITIDPDQSVDEAVNTMKKHGFRRLPVVKNGIIYGVFTAKDLIDHFGELEDKLEKAILRFMPG